MTRWLDRWSAGDSGALDELLPAIQRELEVRARRYLRRERADHTLETAALVNESYLRLIDQNRVRWNSRGHFFAVAAQAMRRILVDHARARAYQKRGSGTKPLELAEALTVAVERPHELVALDDALVELARHDATKSRVVELSFFAGLSHPEIAEVLGVSLSTVERHWRLARAWLYDALAAG